MTGRHVFCVIRRNHTFCVTPGIAAHEVAHAYQVAEGDRAYRAGRSIGEPLASLSPW
jgi:hypothetical protein